jgi:geranylgeranyl reductase family protein
MLSCDVLIVGGGPAGSSCAWRLCQAGLHVVVMDRAPFPRDKTCGGWITPAVVEELELDLEAYAADRVVQPVLGLRTGRLGGRMLTTRYAQPVSYGIRRCEFDHYLLQRSGAQLELGQALTALERVGDVWQINGTWRTPLVIGAGGHYCPVARRLGADPPTTATAVLAQEVEFALTPEQEAQCRVEPEVAELYYCRDLAGYGWCFRKGRWLNVGLGRLDRHGLVHHVSEFRRMLQREGRIPVDLPQAFHGHAYWLYEHSPRWLVQDGAMLIGDAAGLAYTYSGEGIRPAVESGLMAAQTILDARGDYRAARLHPYEQQIRTRFGPRRGVPPKNGRLRQTLTDLAARLLFSSAYLTQHVLVERWFLRAHEQPWRPRRGICTTH